MLLVEADLLLTCKVKVKVKVQGFFICHIINYTGYNQKWNVIKSGPLSGQCKRIKNKNYIKVTQHKSIYMVKKENIDICI